MATPIKTSLQNFTVYNTVAGGNKMLGLAHLQMPNIQVISEALKGSGISGAPDVPIRGHIQNMTATFSFYTLTEDAVTLSAQTDLSLNCRATLQSYDPAVGALNEVPERLVLKGFNRSLNFGRWEVASKSDMVNLEMNVHYLSVWLNGPKVIEIDPFNSVFLVNGFDYLANMRSLL